MLPLSVTTGSDIKQVWLLLEAASSDSIQKKNVNTAILFSTPCPPPAQLPALPMPKLWPAFTSFTYRTLIVVSPLALIRVPDKSTVSHAYASAELLGTRTIIEII